MQKLTLALMALLLSQLTLAAEVIHVGTKVLTPEEYVKVLKPKPKFKTRGIRVAQDSEPQALALNVRFAYNSDQLTDEALAQLTPLGQALNSEELAPYSFVIDGHTDSVGSEEFNLELSQRRALAVGNYLYANFGIDVARLSLTGKGESELYDTSDPESGVNRRVQIQAVQTPVAAAETPAE